MNIFKTNPCPVISAKEACNILIRKMPTETAQLIATCFSLKDLESAPKNKDGSNRKHFNPKHPSALYTRYSKDTFGWVLNHGIALCTEYSKRYKKQHFQEDFFKWVVQNQNKIAFVNTDFPSLFLAMPDEYKVSNHDYLCYQAYINGAKDYCFWPSVSDIPNWYKEKSEKYVDKNFINGQYIKR